MIRKGTKVSWKWGRGFAHGKVVQTHTKKVSKTIKQHETESY